MKKAVKTIKKNAKISKNKVKKVNKKMKIELAAFGAGCFWHVEEAFRTVKGVVMTTVGYMGGKYENPSYEDVCSDKTGHAETCLVEYDPKKVKYEELLEIFWKMHDPTQLNRQGVDFGSQYRSIIFYYDEKQKKIAQKSKENAQSGFRKKIVTEIALAGKFYKAENYHQKYLMKKGAKTCGF